MFLIRYYFICSKQSEGKVHSDHDRPHGRILQTVGRGELWVPQLEFGEVEQVVAAHIEADVLAVNLVAPGLGQGEANLDHLQPEEAHVLLPPGGGDVVVGVLGRRESRPEHVLRGVVLGPAVVVVGIDVAQHALSASGDEIAVAADDLTGVGVADDFLFGPLGAGVGEGLIMIFG